MIDSIITAALSFISGFFSGKLENSKIKPLIAALIISVGMILIMAVLLFIKSYIEYDFNHAIGFILYMKYYSLIAIFILFILNYWNFLYQSKKNK